MLKHAASAVRTFFRTRYFHITDTHFTLEGPPLCALTRPRLRIHVGRSQRQYISDPPLFPFTTDIPFPCVFVTDLVQDFYLKELKSYKAPLAVRSPIHRDLSLASLTRGRHDRPKMLMLAP